MLSVCLISIRRQRGGVTGAVAPRIRPKPPISRRNPPARQPVGRDSGAAPGSRPGRSIPARMPPVSALRRSRVRQAWQGDPASHRGAPGPPMARGGSCDRSPAPRRRRRATIDPPGSRGTAARPAAHRPRGRPAPRPKPPRPKPPRPTKRPPRTKPATPDRIRAHSGHPAQKTETKAPTPPQTVGNHTAKNPE